MTTPTATTPPAATPTTTAAPGMKIRKYKILSFVAGSMALTAGLVMEYVPLIRGGHESGTIPQANAICSGAMGLFVQGMVRAFAPGKASSVQHTCTLATTAEHFIGPLVMLGVLGLVAGLAITILEKNGVLKDGVSA